jgi:hypothetical protein
MADRLYEVRTSYNFENGTTTVLQVSGYSGQLLAGDRAGFRWTTHTGSNQPSSLTVANWSATAWADTTNLSLSQGGAYVYKDVAASPSDQNDSLLVYGPSTSNLTVVITVSSGIDSEPDDTIELGSNVTGANPSSLYYASRIDISGMSIGETATATITGTGQISKNNGGFTTNLTVTNGDSIYTRMEAGSAYGAIKYTTIDVAGFTDTWSISNKADPSEGTLISFGYASGPVPLSAIISFFGGPNNLRAYIKGGTYVPAITGENGNITSSSSANLSVLDFRNSVTSFYFNQPPANKQSPLYNTTSNGITRSLDWVRGVDWTMGFGPGMTNASEYKYTIVSQTNQGSGSASDVTIGSGAGVYSTGNVFVSLQVTVPQNVERFYSGVLRIHARKNGVETSTDVQYNFGFYGP